MDSTKSPALVNYFSADFAIRLLLLASSSAALVVLATSKQTEMVPISVAPFFEIRSARLHHSPALTFLISGLAATIFYGASTMIVSAAAVRKIAPPAKLLFNLLVLDGIMAGLMAAATGAGGGVAYIGLRGNAYEGWKEICHVYGSFCRHVGGAVGLALLSSIALLLLSVLSGYSLYRRAI